MRPVTFRGLGHDVVPFSWSEFISGLNTPGSLASNVIGEDHLIYKARHLILRDAEAKKPMRPVKCLLTMTAISVVGRPCEWSGYLLGDLTSLTSIFCYAVPPGDQPQVCFDSCSKRS